MNRTDSGNLELVSEQKILVPPYNPVVIEDFGKSKQCTNSKNTAQSITLHRFIFYPPCALKCQYHRQRGKQLSDKWSHTLSPQVPCNQVPQIPSDHGVMYCCLEHFKDRFQLFLQLFGVFPGPRHMIHRPIRLASCCTSVEVCDKWKCCDLQRTHTLSLA